MDGGAVFGNIQRSILGSIRWVVWGILAWSLLSAVLIRNLLDERQTTFKQLVNLHQEFLLTGQWRTFIEASDQYSRSGHDGYREVNICWVSATDACLPSHSASSLLGHRISIFLGQPKPVVLVTAEIDLSRPVLLIFGALVLLIASIVILKRTKMRIDLDILLAEHRVRKAVKQVVNAKDTEVGVSGIPSEIRPLAEELFSVQQDLKLSESSRKEMATSYKIVRQVAHDIRSPISALRLIAASNNLSRSPHEVDLIKKISDRIQTIAGDLLNLSRQDFGNESLELVSCSDLENIVSHICSEQQMAHPQGPRLEIALERTSGLVKVCPAQFGRIVSNIIQNAIEASKHDNVVRVFLGERGQCLSLEVVDSGIGIPARIIERIGIERVSWGKPSGNGLGLLYAGSFVRKWQGDFQVKSKVGNGTTLIIKLPIVGLLEVPNSVGIQNQVES